MKNIINTLLLMKLQENALFIFFDEYNQFNTTQFLMMAIKYYGYIPNIIQTDNGPEFTFRTGIKLRRIVSLLISANFIISYIKPFVLEPLDTMGRLNVLIVMITTDFINS